MRLPSTAIVKLGTTLLVATLVTFSVQSAPLSLQDVPLYLLSRADPNVLINMSVETPMGGAAYTDQVGVPAGCNGRVDVSGHSNIGTCYFPTTKYLGYFDSDTCYTAAGTGATSQFNPAGPATNRACAGNWSGNFLNWMSMTAIDMFVQTMTGGNRIVDTTSETVIRRARKHHNDSWFPIKAIGSGINVAASTIGPFSASSTVYFYNTDFGFRASTNFDSARNGSGTYIDLRTAVRVCTTTGGNCVAYGSPTYYKPEGSIQRNGSTKRFGAIGYSLDGSNTRDGGVLRSNIKYVGPLLPDGSANPNREYGTDGILISNPDGATGGLNSGVINYVNKFSDPGYKSLDPVSELFYESIRYFKNLGPTPEYSSGLSTLQLGGFQIPTWQDPQQYSCQKNFIVAINDANPWLDKRVPGTFFTSSVFGATTLDGNDYGQPSNADTSINATALTNTVGALEGLNNTTWNSTGTWTSGPASGANDSVGGGITNFNNSCDTKAVTNLGEVMGTCPYPGKQNSYYVAGLAYYANTTDLRSDFTNERGIQNVKSFVIDTQEYSTNPLDGPKNMLWLAGKYGGFIDTNNNNQPDLASEWDADNNGIPDNYVLATQPQSLVSGLDRAFDFIDRQVSSAASASINSASFSARSKIYQTRFNSGSWTGQLLAFQINADGTLGTNPIWDASRELPSPASRTIITRNANGAAVPFEWASLDTTRQTQLGSQEILNYLRGDATNEYPIGSYRGRTEGSTPNKLGDIVSSAPLYVAAPPFRYRENNYASFATANQNRTPMVYVGANDGMLHAFDASENVSQYGEEKFAFIPSKVFRKLPRLAQQSYNHTYFVDGSPSMGDAYINRGTGVNWHTVLVAGLNGGGQGIYALDITNPATLTSNPQSAVMWEFTDANDADLGFTFSQPTIARLAGNRWVAVFGNGYNSTQNVRASDSTSTDPNGNDAAISSTGNAVLYVVDLATGALLRKLDTGVGVAQAAAAGVTYDNGLSTPALVDLNGDRTVDYAFAGDLYGNMWKFDLTSTDNNAWSIAFGGQPLFTATDGTNRQPITVRPEVTRGPAGAGMLVLFGTGKYLERTDVNSTPTRVQSFYGIIDTNTGTRVTSRLQLTQQSILTEGSFDPADPDGTGPLPDPPSQRVRTTSANPVNNSGWYIDLLSPSGYQNEKQVTNPIVRNGNVIFTTVIPESNPCSGGGRSWIMEMSALTGSRLETAPFDLNNDGLFTTADSIPIVDGSGNTIGHTPVSGVASDSGMGILQTPGVIDAERGEGRPVQYKYSPGSLGGIQRITENPGAGATGRQSWQQVR